ncbi:MAG: prolyl oligopeptidase family serine peptidase [Porticoccus sp.]
MSTTAPYGSWASPIDPELLATSSPSFAYPSSDRENLYWLESRPWENGRSVIVQRDCKGTIRDVLPAPLSARSMVHEYGGTPYIVANDILYFCLYDDQRLYRLDLNKDDTLPTPISPAEGYRFADFCYDKYQHRLICVAEIHNSSPEPENQIVAIPLDDSMQVVTLCSGDDFYAYPRLDNTGRNLCWISWNHPDMPWDNTTLWLATIDNAGQLDTPISIAGNGEEAIFQPQWSPDNQLYFVSDRDNWWNLYRWLPSSGVEPIQPMTAEFATPLWVLGMSTYGFCDDGTLVCCHTHDGTWQLSTKKPNASDFQPVENDYCNISDIYCAGDNAWLVGASHINSGELAELDIKERSLKSITQSVSLSIDPSYIAQPSPINYPTSDQATSHAFFYQPTNPDFKGCEGSLPPLIVICHGGPTGSTTTALNLKIQYWTSRGFAVLDVNYRGSTGYGRHYREQLHGQWGIADVTDVVAGANYLIERKKVDPEKIAIRGSSAGGYTVLSALCFYQLFKAGACLYGIGDLETLARDTHKFESRYLDKLIGPYPSQQAIYQDRSPIHHIDQFNCPVIFFQGLDDKVVPPEQTVAMTKALREKRLPVAYLPFEGEGHGFRMVETIKQSLEAELFFYGKVFGFAPHGDLPTIPINNLI